MDQADHDELKGLPLDRAADAGGTVLARAMRIALIHDGVMPKDAPLPDLTAPPPKRATIKNMEFSNAARRAAWKVEQGATEPVPLAKSILVDVYTQRIAMDMIFADFDPSHGNPPADYKAIRAFDAPPAIEIASMGGYGRDLDAISEGRFHDVRDEMTRGALTRDLSGAMRDTFNAKLEHGMHDIDASLPAPAAIAHSVDRDPVRSIRTAAIASQIASGGRQA